MADSTLQAIRTKVRRLTRSVSDNMLPTATIDEYINTFVLYDFPEHLRLSTLHKTLTFYTSPNVATYTTNTTLPNDPLFNFNNRYITNNEPVFIAGYKTYFTQSRDEFFGQWPQIVSQQQIATGDGGTTNFVATATNTILNPPFLQNNVTISSIDASNNPLIVRDEVVNSTTGNLIIPSTGVNVGTINYITGAYNFTFAAAPASGEPVYAQTVPYVASRPTTVLYYDTTFTFRPVPDISYAVNIEVYERPTELLASNQSPQLQQWWQYIAYGASKKVFEDRTDIESVQQLMPEFKEQERLVLRQTLVQQGDQRAATIYQQQAALGAGPFGWWNSNF